jgi:hypothetical protein
MKPCAKLLDRRKGGLVAATRVGSDLVGTLSEDPEVARSLDGASVGM